MSPEVKILRGRTGSVTKIISNKEAVFTDVKYKDITFTKDVVRFQKEDKKGDFRDVFPIGEKVYYDLEVCKKKAKCLSIWVGRKPNLVDPAPIVKTGVSKLKKSGVYKATVTKMRPPFACIAQINDTEECVIIWNCKFMPTRGAPKLQKSDPLICYLKKHDTVFVNIYKRGSEWSASDAWKEENEGHDTTKTSELKSSSKKNLKPKEKQMTGKVIFIGKHIGVLVRNDIHEPVSFDRNNTFLFGIPLKDFFLDTIFTKGMNLNFTLSKEIPDEASCVWFGSPSATKETEDETRDRLQGLIGYFKNNRITDPMIKSTLVCFAHAVENKASHSVLHSGDCFYWSGTPSTA